MAYRPVIFISCVSKELRSARQLVANTLQYLGYAPDWQDIFGTEQGDLWTMLKRRIDLSSGVLQIVGSCYGVEPYEMDSEFGRVSYTQFEALYAEKRGKRVWYLIVDDNFPVDDFKQEPEELIRLQHDYKERLVNQSPNLSHPCSSLDGLEARILKLRSEFQTLRRNFKYWAIGISVVLIVSLFLTLGIRDKQDKTISEAKKAAVAGKEASETAQEAVDAIKEVDTKVEQSSVHIKGMRSTLDIDSANMRLETAIKAADLSNRGQVEAIEFLLNEGFSYENASLDGVSFAGAIMHGANFSSSSFQDGDLSKAEFDRGKLDSANLNFAVLSNASFRKVSAKKTYFQYTNAVSADFEGASLNRSSFFLSNLREASFKNADLHGVCLAFCDLTGADFSRADLTDTIIFSSVLDKAKFDGAVIKDTDVGASVADTISFTPEQRNELSRSSPLTRYLDIRIWGHARHSDDWDANYPDFNSYYTKLIEIPMRLSGSLKSRSNDALQPVGPFYSYDRDGPNDIRSSNWFETGFWEKGNRSRNIKKRLKDHGEFLFEEIGKQMLIEGSGQELQAWVSFIENKSEAISYTGPLIWTNDAYITLLLSEDIMSPEDISEYDWKSLAIERCRKDAMSDTNVREDSWEPMYPQEAMCQMLPSNHVGAYKRWTLARAKVLDCEQIEAVYTISLSNLNRSQRVNENKRDSKRQQILLFANLKNTYEHLHASMVPSTYRYKSQTDLLGSPTRVRKGYALFKLPAARNRYVIEINPNNLPTSKTGKSSYDTWYQFRVVFHLSGITKDGGTYEFAVEPRSALIEVDGKQIWEGLILVPEKTAPVSSVKERPPIQRDFEEASGPHVPKQERGISKGLLRLMKPQPAKSNSTPKHQAEVAYTKADRVLRYIGKRYDGAEHPRGVLNDEQFKDVIGAFEKEKFGGYADILKRADKDLANGYTKEKVKKYTEGLKGEKVALLEEIASEEASRSPVKKQELGFDKDYLANGLPPAEPDPDPLQAQANVGKAASMALRFIGWKYVGGKPPKYILSEEQVKQVIGAYEEAGYKDYTDVLRRSNDDFAKGYTANKMDGHALELQKMRDERKIAAYESVSAASEYMEEDAQKPQDIFDVNSPDYAKKMGEIVLEQLKKDPRLKDFMPKAEKTIEEFVKEETEKNRLEETDTSTSVPTPGS